MKAPSVREVVDSVVFFRYLDVVHPQVVADLVDVQVDFSDVATDPHQVVGDDAEADRCGDGGCRFHGAPHFSLSTWSAADTMAIEAQAWTRDATSGGAMDSSR